MLITISLAYMFIPMTETYAETAVNKISYEEYINECLPIYLNDLDSIGSEITYSPLIP